MGESELGRIYERLNAVEGTQKVHDAKLSDLRELVESIKELTKTSIAQTENLKTVSRDVTELKGKVDTIEQKPAQTMTAVKMAVISALATATVGTLIALLLTQR